jgi:hypothetical protein
VSGRSENRTYAIEATTINRVWKIGESDVEVVGIIILVAIVAIVIRVLAGRGIRHFNTIPQLVAAVFPLAVETRILLCCEKV